VETDADADAGGQRHPGVCRVPSAGRRLSGDGLVADITNPKLLYLKGGLFVVAGVLASALLILDHPTWPTVVLLAVAIWCFARAYYFAFYVVEHYADPGYRFSGLWSFVRYLLRRRGQIPPPAPPGEDAEAAPPA
jgi:hypothetical protein